MMSLARRRFTASATRCCCAPSWRLRSTRRRSASPLATILARDSRRASACLRTSSRVVCSAVSSWELWSAKPDLARQVGEHAVVVLGERARHRRPLDDDQAQQLAGVADRRHPDLLLLALLEQSGQPDGRPRGPRHAGAGDDRPLPWGHDDGPMAQVGNRGGALQDLARPGEDLGAGEAHRLAEGLGELQEQLVHRDGSGQPAPEGSQHLVGCLPRAVDEPRGGPEEALAHRHEDERRPPPRRPSRAPATSLSPRRLGRVPEAQHHDQVDGRDHDDEPEHRQDLDESPARVRPQLSALRSQEAERDEDGRPRRDGTRAGPASPPGGAAPWPPTPPWPPGSLRCRTTPCARGGSRWTRCSELASARWPGRPRWPS